MHACHMELCSELLTITSPVSIIPFALFTTRGKYGHSRFVRVLCEGIAFVSKR